MSATATESSGPASSLEAVEPPRVVREDLPLLGVSDVAPVADLVEGGGIAVVPVGEVGGVDDLVLPDQLERLREQPLVGLAGEEDGPAPDVVARLAGEPGRLRSALGVLVVHPLRPVGGPAAPGLEIGDAQAGEALRDALEDHRGDLSHLPER